MDIGQEFTEARLKEIERRINKEYAQAIEELEDELTDYFQRYKKKDETWRRWVEEGTRTQQEYNEWRTGQLAIGERWNAQKTILATELAHVNEIAKQIVKNEAPQIFADNFNYATYQLEKDAQVDTAFTLYNREAVERLIRDDPEVLPAVGKKVSKAIAEGKAVKWNKQQLQSVMTQGILQGDSIPKLATRLANTVGDRDRKAAIRNARTMATGAQNAGRVNAYKRAKDKGVDVEQMWLAVMDNRTRHSHRWLDGEVRPVGEAFSNGCEYPADPKGDPAEIYNCRCTLRGVVKGLQRMSGKYRDMSGLEGMSYDEWRNAKAKSNPITLQEEKGKNIKQAYLGEYRRDGNIFSLNNGARDSSFDAVKMVYFNENADYSIRFNDYSDEVNAGISKAARMVAELGSKKGVEYAALVDVVNGKISQMGTSWSDDSVKSYFKYIENHPDRHFVMVHNHPTESLLSYPDVEQLIRWDNLDGVVSTSNNGITNGVQSNGFKSDQYEFAKYANDYRRIANETGSQIEAEYAVVKMAVKDFCKGDMIIHDGRQ